MTKDYVKQRTSEELWEKQQIKHAEKTYNKNISSKNQESLPSLMKNLQLGNISSATMDNLFLFRRIASLTQKHSTNLLKPEDDRDLFRIKQIQIGHDQHGILCLGDMNRIKSVKLQYFNIKECNLKEGPKVKLDSKNTFHVEPIATGVTSMCLVKPKPPYCSHVLYTTLLQTSASYVRSYAHVDIRLSLNTKSQSRYDLGPGYLWTTAWNPSNENFSVGLENHSLIVRTDRREFSSHKLELKTDSDPLAQVFNTEVSLIKKEFMHQ